MQLRPQRACARESVRIRAEYTGWSEGGPTCIRQRTELTYTAKSGRVRCAERYLRLRDSPNARPARWPKLPTNARSLHSSSSGSLTRILVTAAASTGMSLSTVSQTTLRSIPKYLWFTKSRVPAICLHRTSPCRSPNGVDSRLTDSPTLATRYSMNVEISSSAKNASLSRKAYRPMRSVASRVSSSRARSRFTVRWLP